MTHPLHALRNRLLKLVLSEERTRSDAEAISKGRSKLSRDLGAWRKTQLQRFPKLRDHIPKVDFTVPEEEQLMLPSSFTSEMRKSLGLTRLADVEYRLREGQAYDALQSLRQTIQEYNHNLLNKAHNVHGVKHNTRAETFLRGLTADKHTAAGKYRLARDSMVSLGLSDDDTYWRPLRDTELWGKSVSKKRKLGDGKTRDPWFWSVVQPKGLTDEKQKEWSTDSTSILSISSSDCH